MVHQAFSKGRLSESLDTIWIKLSNITFLSKIPSYKLHKKIKRGFQGILAQKANRYSLVICEEIITSLWKWLESTRKWFRKKTVFHSPFLTRRWTKTRWQFKRSVVIKQVEVMLSLHLTQPEEGTHSYKSYRAIKGTPNATLLWLLCFIYKAWILCYYGDLILCFKGGLHD